MRIAPSPTRSRSARHPAPAPTAPLEPGPRLTSATAGVTGPGPILLDVKSPTAHLVLHALEADDAQARARGQERQGPRRLARKGGKGQHPHEAPAPEGRAARGTRHARSLRRGREEPEVLGDHTQALTRQRRRRSPPLCSRSRRVRRSARSRTPSHDGRQPCGTIEAHRVCASTGPRGAPGDAGAMSSFFELIAE